MNWGYANQLGTRLHSLYGKVQEELEKKHEASPKFIEKDVVKHSRLLHSWLETHKNDFQMGDISKDPTPDELAPGEFVCFSKIMHNFIQFMASYASTNENGRKIYNEAIKKLFDPESADCMHFGKFMEGIANEILEAEAKE